MAILMMNNTNRPLNKVAVLVVEPFARSMVQHQENSNMAYRELLIKLGVLQRIKDMTPIHSF
jgi:hypothetical protein